MATTGGSTWRKWDLHTHIPGTRLNNQYGSQSEANIDRFCRIIHDSDVEAIALTDYFSVDGQFRVRDRYQELYDNSSKLLLVNLELRLDLRVNSDAEYVNVHVIFNPSLEDKKLRDFLSNLETTWTDSHTGLAMKCSELKDTADFEGATVSIKSIETAIEATFGKNTLKPDLRRENLLLITSGKGDGIRINDNAPRRSKNHAISIDNLCDAVFGNASTRSHYLDPNRYGATHNMRRLPTWDGCDAHSLESLEGELGNTTRDSGGTTNTLWVKSDVSYRGLLQTLLEPEERSFIGPIAPDLKDEYRVIERIIFNNSSQFPSEIKLNANLNAIIGSRSSGKSTLLSHIAYSVNPEEAVDKQIAASAFQLEPGETGPAAGITWDEVQEGLCEVIWCNGDRTPAGGRVTYLPQNSLFMLGDNPIKVAEGILPVLEANFPGLIKEIAAEQSNISRLQIGIAHSIDRIWSIYQDMRRRHEALRELGDVDAVSRELTRLQDEVREELSDASLSPEDIAQLEAVRGQLERLELECENAKSDQASLEKLFELSENASVAGNVNHQRPKVGVDISIEPSVDLMPSEVRLAASWLVDETKRKLEASMASLVGQYKKDYAESATYFDNKMNEIRDENETLLVRGEAIEAVKGKQTQVAQNTKRLNSIQRMMDSQFAIAREMVTTVRQVGDAVSRCNSCVTSIVDKFNQQARIVDSIEFVVEAEFNEDSIRESLDAVNRSRTSRYRVTRDLEFNYELAQSDVPMFIRSLLTGDIALSKGSDAKEFAKSVLTITKEVRYGAILDGDKIGGFGRSSMTPGKQALFALSLHLNGDDAGWPLLLDQPEDDLDSRSIFDTIVPYLRKEKKRRQIVMVTHNANLVVGADAEQIIVANRHGVDRPNKEERVFDYRGGSIEEEMKGSLAHRRRKNRPILNLMSVKEHACELLDGGAEAFRKRQLAYGINGR